MSDSIKKWHEMQEDKAAKIYESPDGGKTVTSRPFAADVSERQVIKHPGRLTQELKKQAYTLLAKYDEDVIRMANKILDIGE